MAIEGSQVDGCVAFVVPVGVTGWVGGLQVGSHSMYLMILFRGAEFLEEVRYIRLGTYMNYAFSVYYIARPFFGP